VLSPPWRTTATQADGGVVVLATVLRLRRTWQGPAFVRDALAIRRQLLAAPGAIGVALRAGLLSGEYRTISTWTDQQSLTDFVRADPHRAAMRRWQGNLVDARFLQWSQEDPTPPTWAAAAHRLDDDGIQRA
jgi:heme-degrading monooxygenase HmoA